MNSFLGFLILGFFIYGLYCAAEKIASFVKRKIAKKKGQKKV